MAEIGRVLPEVVEGPGRGVGVGKVRDRGLVEYTHRSRDRGTSHPARDDRLVLDMGERTQRLRRLEGIGHLLRREYDEQPVAVRVVRRCLQRLRITLRICIAQHVDRVGMTPVDGKRLVQQLHGLLGHRCQLSAALNERVGCEHTRTAGVGNDGEPPAPGARLLRQQIRHREQLGDAFHTQDPHAPECRIEGFVVASQ